MAALTRAPGSRVERAAGLARNLGRGLLSFALPQVCPGCGAPARPDAALCEACRDSIPPLAAAICARCLLGGRDPDGCRRHPGHEVWAARIYDERAARLVRAFKYGGRPVLAGAMAGPIAGVLPASLRPDLVIGVPLHRARLRERGFDPAARLAEAVASRLEAPYLPDALVRVRATRPQVGLPERVRRANLSGAFAAARPGGLRGRRVLVVDDVLTTGATLEGCLDVLAAAGARGSGAAYAWAQ